MHWIRLLKSWLRMSSPSSFCSSVIQAWSRSYVEMYTIAHEWTIENFVELDEEATIIFKIAIEGNEELKFKLSLKPRYDQVWLHPCENWTLIRGNGIFLLVLFFFH